MDLLASILVPRHELVGPEFTLLIPGTVVNVDDTEVLAKRLGPKLLLGELVLEGTKVRPGALVDTNRGLHDMLDIPLTKGFLVLNI